MGREDFLLIIDVQRGFINEATQHIPAQVEALQHNFSHVIATRFINRAGGPHDKILGWKRFQPESPDTKLAFAPAPHVKVIEKTKYSALNEAVYHELCHTLIDRVFLAGLDTDACVLKTALDLFDMGVRPVILSDYCASHGGADLHESALSQLRRLIGAEHVISGKAESFQ